MSGAKIRERGSVLVAWKRMAAAKADQPESIRRQIQQRLSE